MKHNSRASSSICSLLMVLVAPLWGCGSSANSPSDAPFADAAVPTVPPGPDAASGDTRNPAEAAPSAPDHAQSNGPSADAAWISSDAVLAGDILPSADAIALDGALRGSDVVASGCNLDGGPVTLVRLSPQELKAILDGSEDPFLFNVKGTTIPDIPGTDGVFASDASGVEKFVGDDRCADIIIYCRSGVISQQVGAKLIADGYRRVRDLTGGILAWQAAGYPTK